MFLYLFAGLFQRLPCFFHGLCESLFCLVSGLFQALSGLVRSLLCPFLYLFCVDLNLFFRGICCLFSPNPKRTEAKKAEYDNPFCYKFLHRPAPAGESCIFRKTFFKYKKSKTKKTPAGLKKFGLEKIY